MQTFENVYNLVASFVTDLLERVYAFVSEIKEAF